MSQLRSIAHPDLHGKCGRAQFRVAESIPKFGFPALNSGLVAKMQQRAGDDLSGCIDPVRVVRPVLHALHEDVGHVLRVGNIPE